MSGHRVLAVSARDVLPRAGGKPDRFPRRRCVRRRTARAILGRGTWLAGGEARQLRRVDRTGGGPFEIDFRFAPDGPKLTKNRLHLDVKPVNRDQAAELDRLLALGARQVDVGQGAQNWFVLADPEGNEFCLCRP
jgi:hypothetical protein